MEDPHFAQSQHLTQSIVDELISQMTTSAGWHSIGSKDGFEGFNIPRDGPQIVKVIGFIDRPAQTIREYIWENSNKKKWDESNKHSTIVKTFSPNLRILHEETNAPWPVSNRDSVIAQAWVERSDGFLIIGKSIPGVVPDVNGVIRAEVIIQGTYLQRETDTRTKITMLGSIDPKGSIPNMVIKKMSKKQIDKLLAMKKSL